MFGIISIVIFVLLAIVWNKSSLLDFTIKVGFVAMVAWGLFDQGIFSISDGTVVPPVEVSEFSNRAVRVECESEFAIDCYKILNVVPADVEVLEPIPHKPVQEYEVESN